MTECDLDAEVAERVFFEAIDAAAEGVNLQKVTQRVEGRERGGEGGGDRARGTPLWGTCRRRPANRRCA